MSSDNHIRYLPQKEIDKSKWDECISNANNGLIYAYSHYLDRMAKNWDALILNDHEAIMPLTWNKKYGLYYLYHPAFTASLGVFGNSLTETLVENFIKAIPKKFKLIEIPLNVGNIFSVPTGFDMLRNNYTLSLNKNYDSLYSSYNDNIRRNIKKAQHYGCTIKKNIPVADVIDLSRPSLQKQTNVTDEDYNNFEKLFNFLYQQNKAITYGVYSNTNELIASCVYFFSHNRAYYILVGNHPNGKTLGASHYLIDRFIYDHAGQNLILDFEGSDIRNLAFFYSSFGAQLEVYPFLKINRLPFWAKWAK
ncbi:MAG TPA: hypothetical protein VHZ50_03475 [Puia sp.]|jgi:hypothetical protein|nr:hypothetical protein [Puia sp.]